MHMLHTLKIRHFVLIEHLDVSFYQGMTTITGESGAGKSMVFDAIDVLLGAKVAPHMHYVGAAQNNMPIDIEAEFTISPELAHILADKLPQNFIFNVLKTANIIHIKRVIDRQNKSRFWLNQQSIASTIIKDIAADLVHMHTQHAQQALTQKNQQLLLLDQLVQAWQPHSKDIYAQLITKHQNWQNHAKTLQKAQDQQASQSAQHEAQLWMYEQLQTLEPKSQEWAQLQLDHARLSSTHDRLRIIHQLSEQLHDDTGVLSSIDALQQDVRQLAKMDAEMAEKIQAYLNQAHTQLQELHYELKQYQKNMDDDPDTLLQLESRLQHYLDVARKIKQPVDALGTLYQDSQVQCAQYSAQDIQDLQDTTQAAWQVFLVCAQQISTLREQVIQETHAHIEHYLTMLGMPDQCLYMILESDENAPHVRGIDQCQFYLQNAQKKMQSLAKIASGGELSRILLALLASMNMPREHMPELSGDLDSTDTYNACTTLLFDEIDSGMSGLAGEAVGQVLQQIGKKQPIIVITHLAQVAASAQHHLKVEKNLVDGVSKSCITYVHNQVRCHEVARLMSGQATSGETAYQHAKHLLDTYQTQT